MSGVINSPTHLAQRQAAARATSGTAGGFGVYLPREEAERVLGETDADSRAGLLLRTLWQSGGRIEEVRRLKVDDVHFAHGTIRLVTLKRGKDPKTGLLRPPVYRLVPVQPDLLGLLGRYLATWRLQPADRFWEWTVRHCNRVVSEAMRACGVRRELCHPHAWRHGHAIAAIRAGVPLPILQANLGHSSLTTTARYLQFTVEDRKAAYKGVF